jgi:hypothetical protein
MKEALSSSERRFLQGPHGVTSQKTAFSIVLLAETDVPGTNRGVNRSSEK